ncbi:MarR family winged helix-turn-helix transcriptional regulator [Pelobacter propionicus]|uniref:Transcriptional regulator, MarR family n=1 Tax=Pelobacter propionicus (strain DSM 2379 / NBRC 103807 / OttBd1) TaxID=338966 RepID=A1AMB9_PELPD|nr:MarR family transcriptional regulator [Pelobacter propionicus]ABK98489.1 transcriptional regulator, MarR family [Pelobacter propionicus DSM 2379]
MNDSDRLLHNLHQTTRVIARGINRVLEPWGLSSSEWSLIRALKLHGPQTQRSLAAFLHIEPPAITKSLARLEQRGLIDRSEGMDRRTKTTSLSERAVQLYPQWEERIREHRSSLLAGLSGEQQNELQYLLTHIRENARKYVTPDGKGELEA